MRSAFLVLVVIVFLIGLVAQPSQAQSGPDNRYCAPGDRATFGATDGPAALPSACIYTAISATPSPGNLISVAAGDDLRAAVNAAQCGDTISLQAGATFTGNFLLPARKCDAGHWITIRTSAPDSSLPAEGTRLTPCYAGVGSIPGRPDFSCSNPQRVVPQISSPNTISPIVLSGGANYYRFIGLEITRSAGSGYITDLVAVKPGYQADHIILDRVWLHGSTHDDTRTALNFTGMTNGALIDSYANDFHCTSAVGACTDAHAVAGGLGDFPGGPYKVVNNYLEASGENILFGGGNASTTPTDLEIRRNHMCKPMLWKPGQPGFVGGKDGRAFIVKNLTELKNAQRVLFEGNLLENSWGGFSQDGGSILLTPKNQFLNNKPRCPNCEVIDVTIRYSYLRHSGEGMQIASSLSGKPKLIYQAKAAARYSIHDIIIDDVNAVRFNGSGTLFQIFNGWSKNVLNTVLINHVTGFGDPSSHLLSLIDQNSLPKISTVGFSNNLVLSGRYPVWSGAGSGDCASNSTLPIKNLNACFNPYAFLSNGIIGSPDAFPPSTWPAKNYFPGDPNAVQFVNYNNGNGGDYHLLSSSPYKNAGTDGKDLGADIDAVMNAIDGVD